MISSSEKQRLLEAYRAPFNARAAVARAAAGLAIVFGIALIGFSSPGEVEPRAATNSLNSQQAASGR